MCHTSEFRLRLSGFKNVYAANVAVSLFAIYEGCYPPGVSPESAGACGAVTQDVRVGLPWRLLYAIIWF